MTISMTEEPSSGSSSPEALFHKQPGVKLLPFGLLLLLYLLFPDTEDPAATGVVINEVSASNHLTVFDNARRSADWVELYNGGPEVVDLTGYHLTDNVYRPDKWVFPEVALAPSAFLLVWCTGKSAAPAPHGVEVIDDGRLTVPPALHANFKLKRGGETVLLTRPNGAIADVVTLPTQRVDRSYGRFPDGIGEFVYFLHPTPQMRNTGPTSEQAISFQPEMDPPGGEYSDPVEVEISVHLPLEKVWVHFTTDGRAPTKLSPLYQKPILLGPAKDKDKAGIVLRAAAFWQGQQLSAVSTHSYFFHEDDYQLPIISISAMSRADFNKVHLDYGAYGFESERKGHVEFIEKNGRRAAATGMGLRLHGTSGRYGNQLRLKKSYRMYFRNAYGDRKLDFRPFPGLERRAFDKLVLRANSNDAFRSSDRATYIRDQLLRELHEDMGGIVAHGAWYNLFVNMTYRGVYNLVERIDKNFLSSVFPEEGENWDVWNGDAVDGDGTSWNELFEFFLEGDLSNEALYERVLELVNIEDFTAYIILHIWAQNHDWPHKNWIAVRPRRSGARWRFLTWDGEYAFGLHPANFTANTFDRAFTRADSVLGEIFSSLMKSPRYRSYFLKELDRHLEGALRPENVLSRIDAIKRLLAHDIRRDLKLPLIERRFEAWEANVSFLEEFARNRGPVIRDWIVNDPRAGVQAGDGDATRMTPSKK